MKILKRALGKTWRWFWPAKGPELVLCCVDACLNDGTEVVTIAWEGTGHDNVGTEMISVRGSTQLHLCVDHYAQRMAQAHPEWRIDGFDA